MTKASQMVTAYKAATRLTLSVVDTLSKGLARNEGPKTIVFFSEGFVLQEQESELRQAVGQAARAGAHFYTVDARGLNTGTGANIIDQPVADGTAGLTARFDMQADGTNSLVRRQLSRPFSRSELSLENLPKWGSANHGGILRISTASRMALAQGRVCSYVIRENGAASPERWQT